MAEMAEEMAIKECDKKAPFGCLTWDEVEACVAEFKAYMDAFGIPPPTKEMYDAMAHDEDGVPCLSFEDWKNFQG